MQPKLRFSEFRDEWEKVTLGDIYKKSNEKNDNNKFNEDKIISVAKMIYSNANCENSKKSSNSSYLATYNVIRVGDIAFEGHKNKNFAFGRFVLNDLGDGIVSHVFNCLRPVAPQSLSFWKEYIHNESVMRNVLRRSTKSSTMMNDLVYSDFIKRHINVPSDEEQIKIGALLSKLDKLIELQSSKIDCLKQLKKGYLQRLFLVSGTKMPRLRFREFKDKWQRLKLKDVSKSFSGGTPTASNKSYYGGNIPFIRSSELSSNSTELYISSKGLENSSAKIVKQGTLLYAMYGATSGTVGISKINGAINQAVLAIVLNNRYDIIFTFNFLKLEKNKIVSTYLQGGQGNLSANIIKQIIIQDTKNNKK